MCGVRCVSAESVGFFNSYVSVHAQELFRNNMTMRIEAQQQSAAQTHVAYCIPVATARACAHRISVALSYCPSCLRPGHAHAHGPGGGHAQDASETSHAATRIVWANGSAAAPGASAGSEESAVGGGSVASLDAVNEAGDEESGPRSEKEALLPSASKRE